MDSPAPQSETPQDVEAFLGDTVLYQEDRFDWLRPLLQRSLHDHFGPDDLESRVARQFGDFHPDEQSYRDLIRGFGEPTDEAGRVDHVPAVRLIQELSRLYVEAGVTEIEDVRLTQGLNVLYTQDSQEQKKVWSTLRRAFRVGDESTRGEPSGSGTECELAVLTEDEEERTLTQDGEGDPVEVRVFDQSLSQFLLRRTEDGDFEVAPHEAEKIVRLRENFTYLQGLFEYRLEELEWEIADDIVFLEDQAGFSLEEEFEPTLDAVENMEFSRSDESTLQEHLTELEELEEEAETHQADRLEEAVRHLHGVLEELGLVPEDGETDSFESLSATTMARRLREAHRIMVRIESLESRLDLRSLDEELPGTWTQSDPWSTLEGAADELVRFVNDQVRRRLPDEPATGQGPPDLDDLETAGPRHLRERFEDWLEAEHERAESALEALRSLVNPSPELARVMEDLERDVVEAAELDRAIEAFQTFLRDLRDGREPDLPQNPARTIQESVGRLQETVRELREQRSQLRDQQSRHLDRIQELKETVRDLKLRRAVVEHRERILNYLTHRKELSQVRELVSELNQARQSLVDGDDRFVQELSSRPYQERLRDEYEWLDFHPPDDWSVEPGAPAEDGARYTRVGPNQLSEVLDPGQQELQSLADFLARSADSDDAEVYLFADPFENLNPQQRSRVILRLFRLARDGHQVLLLVHDRSFFNAVVTLSEEERGEVASADHQLIVHPEVYSWKKKTLVKRWTQLETRIDPMQQKNSGSLARVGLSEEDIRSIRRIYESMTIYLEHFLEVFFMKNLLNQFRPSVRLGRFDRLTEIAPEKIKRIEEDHRTFLDNQDERPEAEQQPKELLQELLRDFKRMKEHYHYQQV